MPIDHLGRQLITFTALGGISSGNSAKPYSYFRTTGTVNTLNRVAASIGQVSFLQYYSADGPPIIGGNGGLILLIYNKSLKVNGHFLRSPTEKMPEGTKVRIPHWLADNPSFHAPLQDMAPLVVKDGYAMLDIVTRPGRYGYTRFLGYNPISLTVPLIFDEYLSQAGSSVESAIAILERMAGRGQFGPAAATQPPAPIAALATDVNGNTNYLVPQNYQLNTANPTGPAYVVAGIDWAGDDLRDRSGRRVRASCSVTLQQFTPLQQFTSTATSRANTPDS